MLCISANSEESVNIPNKGNDKEEYMLTAARESSHQLRGSFGEVSWKVALEPGCRTYSKHPRPIPVNGSRFLGIVRTVHRDR